MAGIATVLLTFASCKKDYLDTDPTNSLSEQSVFTNMSNAWSTINGIHRIMFNQWSSQDQSGQGTININLDVLGDDLVHTSSGNGWFNATYQWSMHRNVSSGSLYYIYRFYYRIIANANMIIENIDGIAGEESEKNAIKGQAYVYRAWGHHMLAQLFGERFEKGSANSGPAVPIMIANTTEGQPRASVQEVYSQANADIDEAIRLLSDATPRKAKSHLDVKVAHGIKARIALSSQEWAVAASEANLARQGMNLMSAEQYQEGFNDIGNPEWIWGSKQVVDQTTYFYSFFAYMSSNFSSTNIRSNPKAINSRLYDQISDSDVRKTLWDPTGESTPIPPNGTRYPYINKKFMVESSSSSVGDVVYMRAAEMMLIEAEAKARLNDGTAADVLYELVSTRDPNYVRSTNSGQALVDEILLQRRSELWGEGFRFLDLKRTNAKLDRTQSNHKADLCEVLEVEPGDKRWQFLIPKHEIDANKALEQNPL